MSCGCGGCIARNALCIGQGNNKRFVFEVRDSDGGAFSVAGATAVVFSVSDGCEAGGNILAGGVERFRRTLGAGGITIAGTGNHILVDVTPANLALLVRADNYYDLTVTVTGGTYTVSAGLFRVTGTNAGI